MNPEIEEALVVLRTLVRDVKEVVNNQRERVERAHDRAGRDLNAMVAKTIPSLDPSVLKALQKSEPEFAKRVVVARAFKEHKPMLFGLISGRGKNYQNDLDFVQIQYKAHVTKKSDKLPEYVVERENFLQQAIKRQRDLENVIATLEKLQKSNGELTDKLRDVIRRLAGSSYNYSRERQDPYAVDEFYFEEDWSLLSDLATELFYLYEAYQVEEALAQESLVPEQLTGDFAVEWVQQGEDVVSYDWVQQQQDDNDRVSQPVPPEEIKTDDSLGYFS